MQELHCSDPLAALACCLAYSRRSAAALAPLRGSSELEQVAADAIRTAFHPTAPGFSGLIDRFLADRQRLIKGPYVSIALPFHRGRRSDWFPELQLPFPPWRHQELASSSACAALRSAAAAARCSPARPPPSSTPAAAAIATHPTTPRRANSCSCTGSFSRRPCSDQTDRSTDEDL